MALRARITVGRFSADEGPVPHNDSVPGNNLRRKVAVSKPQQENERADLLGASEDGTRPTPHAGCPREPKSSRTREGTRHEEQIHHHNRSRAQLHEREYHWYMRTLG